MRKLARLISCLGKNLLFYFLTLVVIAIVISINCISFFRNLGKENESESD